MHPPLGRQRDTGGWGLWELSHHHASPREGDRAQPAPGGWNELARGRVTGLFVGASVMDPVHTWERSGPTTEQKPRSPPP